LFSTPLEVPDTVNLRATESPFAGSEIESNRPSVCAKLEQANKTAAHPKTRITLFIGFPFSTLEMFFVPATN